MAGRHRAVAPNRPLAREVGRVSALLLLTTSPLVHVSTASADGSWGPSPERRAQADDPERDADARDDDADDRFDKDRDSGRFSSTSGDRRSGARKASTRDDDRGYRGRHRVADDGDDDDDAPSSRGSRTRTAYESDDDDRSTRKQRSRSAGASGDDDRATRKSRSRAAESTDDDRSTRRSRTTRAAEVSDEVGTTRKARTQATAAVSSGVSEAKWDRLAQCESHQRWSANTGNGYRGGLQFSDATWRAYGGARYAPSAHQASRAEQIAVAEKVKREQGWNAWPACSRKLGYT